MTLFPDIRKPHAVMCSYDVTVMLSEYCGLRLPLHSPMTKVHPVFCTVCNNSLNVHGFSPLFFPGKPRCKNREESISYAGAQLIRSTWRSAANLKNRRGDFDACTHGISSVAANVGATTIQLRRRKCSGAERFTFSDHVRKTRHNKTV